MKASIWPNAGELVHLHLCCILGRQLVFETGFNEYDSCSAVQASDIPDAQTLTDHTMDGSQALCPSGF